MIPRRNNHGYQKGVSNMRIVVKLGTSTLTHATGKLNIRRVEGLVKVIKK